MPMTTLHILRTSGFSSPDLLDCINTISGSDDLVLIDDGCYNINHSSIAQAQAILKHSIKVVEKHANARGVLLNSHFKAIAMQDLIDLSFTHNNSVTWQ